MELNNIIFSILLILISFFLNKYLLFIFYKSKYNLLADKDYQKPQAFHSTPISIAGGTGVFFSLLILHFYYLLSNEVFFFEYLSFCTLFFMLGFMDDIKININPKIRLMLMLIFLIRIDYLNNLSFLLINSYLICGGNFFLILIQYFQIS